VPIKKKNKNMSLWRAFSGLFEYLIAKHANVAQKICGNYRKSRHLPVPSEIMPFVSLQPFLVVMAKRLVAQ